MIGEKITILLVEDDPDIVKSATMYLEHQGYQVLTLPDIPFIDNYEDAIKICQNQVPHLAILDLQINGEKDGLDIAQYIKKHYTTPIIILTGFQSREFIRRSIEIGINEYLVKIEKPINYNQLGVSIQLLLPKMKEAMSHRSNFAFLDVKEVIKNDSLDNFYMRRKIEWTKVSVLKTVSHIKNCVIIQYENNIDYIYRGTLQELVKQIPGYFVQFSRSEIVNVNKITAISKNSWCYQVGTELIKVSETFQTLELKNKIEAGM